MTKGAEHPPHSRGRKQTVGIVDHDPVFVADTKFTHCGGESLGRRHHVGQGAVGVGNRIDIEIDGAGNMGLAILFTAIAPSRRQVPRAIYDSDLCVVEMGGNPGGID